MTAPGWKHGTSGYTNYKCRCDTCTTEWRTYYREWNAKFKAKKKAYLAELEQRVTVLEEALAESEAERARLRALIPTKA